MILRNFDVLIYLLSICISIGLIQIYLINDQLIAYLLIVILIITIIYVIAFVHGLNHKKRAFTLPLPIYVLTFIIFFKVVQYQDESSFKIADDLITLIERYKKDNHSYPHSLTQLEGNYIDKVPKIWRGLIPSNYIYYFDRTNKSFSLTKKFGKYGGKTWQSSIGS